MTKMNDFDKQWELRRHAIGKAKCPLDEDIIDAMEHRAMSRPFAAAPNIAPNRPPYYRLMALAPMTFNNN